MSEQLCDPDRPALHFILNTVYGSQVRWDLNQLTASLRKLASVSCGLEFLLYCREFRVFPKFVTGAIRLSQLGGHLSRLARRFPLRILRAAIRDMRCRCAEAQQTVNDYWIRLFHAVKDNELWDFLVLQKDSMYNRAVWTVSLRLRRKFSALFT